MCCTFHDEHGNSFFLKVKINFLMVGHTHEDIDQFFSRIAGHIGKNNIRILIGNHICFS